MLQSEDRHHCLHQQEHIEFGKVRTLHFLHPYCIPEYAAMSGYEKDPFYLRYANLVKAQKISNGWLCADISESLLQGLQPLFMI